MIRSSAARTFYLAEAMRRKYRLSASHVCTIMDIYPSRYSRIRSKVMVNDDIAISPTIDIKIQCLIATFLNARHRELLPTLEVTEELIEELSRTFTAFHINAMRNRDITFPTVRGEGDQLDMRDIDFKVVESLAARQIIDFSSKAK